jgi:acyl-CoA dehydrogenase
MNLIFMVPFLNVKIGWIACSGTGYLAWAAGSGLAAAGLVLAVPFLRQALLIRPLMGRVRRSLPAMSSTEREALVAGTVGWEGELFAGRPRWKAFLADPAPVLAPEEQAFLDGPVEELCGLLDDWRIQQEHHDLPPEVWHFIRTRGFLGLVIPREYGGLGFSALAHSQVVLKVAGRSAAAVVTVMVPNSLGPAELLVRYGTPGQKDHFLPRLARGEDLPCFALTGPEAGSDAASIQDRGVVARGSWEGREVLGIRLDWEKRYITLGPVATLLGLAFRLEDPDGLLPEGGEGITIALVPTRIPGITIGDRHDPLGIPFQVGPTRGRGVFLPLDAILGGPAMAGKGWRMLMECLAAGRALSLPGLATGAGKYVALVAGAYARVRRQFKAPIGRFEGVQEPLARIAGHAYVMDAARTLVCGALERGERPAVASAILKYQCTERMRLCAKDGMDILGGAGICLGPRNLMARVHQASPVGITVEGANILTRSLITFGQGVLRCHPHVLEEMDALEAPDGLARFDRAFGAHVRHVLACGVRSLGWGLTSGRFAPAPGGPARRYFQRASRYAAAFAFTADILLAALGGGLKRRERLSGRCADALGHLYLVSACLKQFEDRGRPSEELPLLQWACEDGFLRIEEALDGLARNLPSRPLGWLLRRIVLPLGRGCAGPRDELGGRVASLLLEPSPVRNRLVSGIYLPLDPREPLGRLEDALRKAVAAEPAERKRASGAALEPAEVEAIRLADEARRAVIEVDAFAPG